MANLCVFCKIRDKQIKSSVIFENDYVFVISDIAPKAPIHYLIISKKHIPTVDDISVDDQQLSYHFFAAAQQLGRQLVSHGSYRLVVNTGADAGQSVFHLHMHFLAGGNVPAMMSSDL